MSNPRMTETSYIVLGLLELAEQATPYDLKRFAQLSVFNFWSVPHTQIYTECKRLAEAGLLDERREEGGRRRRFYRLTPSGQKAMDEWRDEPTNQLSEIRDLGLLKLFFGADPPKLASTQAEAHREKLEEFEQSESEVPEMPPGMRLALDLGIAHERVFMRFWSQIAAGEASDESN
ncbi:MAG TPA: PadR family transcriptional regulator [Solirubrobacterales bacterium]|nr:PadR family transcriptional regulator [Solirubrobacterales bacterium]